MFQGNQLKGYCRGHGIILDDAYRVQTSVQAGGGLAASDMHEFELTEGGETALMTVYQPRQYDLSGYGIGNGLGWLVESIFQEVNVSTSEVIFEWRSLDHVDLAESVVGPSASDTSGDGLTKDTPWDYFHINSITKNAQGDYLVSSRHASCIYKISGVDGSVIWRLNGANSSFTLTNFAFSHQHHARWIHENATSTILSLFDNASNGYQITSPHSSGMIIHIDHMSNEATMIRQYFAPDGGRSSSSQGSLQPLANNNIFIGWGNDPSVSEHLLDGTPVFFARMLTGNTMHYRAFKFPWTAHPVDSPALWVYSRTGASPTVFYASWNGATEIASWEFWTSDGARGPWTRTATQERQGFETSAQSPEHMSYAYAEALDRAGNVLGRSAVKKTFVPSEGLLASCTDTSCENAQPPPPPPPPPEEVPPEAEQASPEVEEASPEVEAPPAAAPTAASEPKESLDTKPVPQIPSLDDTTTLDDDISSLDDTATPNDDISSSTNPPSLTISTAPAPAPGIFLSRTFLLRTAALLVASSLAVLAFRHRRTLSQRLGRYTPLSTNDAANGTPDDGDEGGGWPDVPDSEAADWVAEMRDMRLGVGMTGFGVSGSGLPAGHRRLGSGRAAEYGRLEEAHEA